MTAPHTPNDAMAAIIRVTRGENIDLNQANGLVVCDPSINRDDVTMKGLVDRLNEIHEGTYENVDANDGIENFQSTLDAIIRQSVAQPTVIPSVDGDEVVTIATEFAGVAEVAPSERSQRTGTSNPFFETAERSGGLGASTYAPTSPVSDPQASSTFDAIFGPSLRNSGRSAPVPASNNGSGLAAKTANPFFENADMGSAPVGFHDEAGILAGKPIQKEPVLAERVETAANIIEQRIETPIQTIISRAEADAELRDALVTEKTTNGVRVGAWEICKNEGGRVASYDVVRIDTREVLAKDLSIYDAAVGITSALNAGETINSPKVRKILVAEARYAQHRQSAALHYRTVHLAEERGDEMKRDIAQARLDESLAKAREAYDAVTTLVAK